MIYKTIAEYMQEWLAGCSFVGIEENTGELLVSFDSDTTDQEKVKVTKHLLDKFDEVKKVIIVEMVDIKKATQMVDDLNKMLAEETPAQKTDKKPDLLDIGDF
ncbi:hypothetical protein LCGC14_1919280 [marine sediment metagenome]|uniref:Uncharacterized protein n=1 Tax=marine sediment metagenome TaxID=412755 RepID=A0A0F9FS22_9ZZZZ|nr:hypothetical protein [Candidatus Aminicenantes bacterium]